jgi:hypothetical protein
LARADKGEVTWTQGSEANFFGVVGTGFVKMTSPGPDYQEITM